jgi:prepilin-type N-terminal cleavage/methylation domain-containing protein
MKHKQDGFTLVEILVSIGILAFCILGVMALLPNDYRLITSSGRISALNHIAQQTLDQLRTRPITSLDLLDGIHPSSSCSSSWDGTSLYGNCNQTFPLQVSYTISSGGLAYPEEYTVSWFVASEQPRPGMKRVEVRVGYRVEYDGNGNALDPDPSVPDDQRLVRMITHIE